MNSKHMSDIIVSALMQTGSLTFLTFLLFRAETLNVQAPNGGAPFSAFECASAAIIAMVIVGIAGTVLLARKPVRMVPVIAAVQVALSALAMILVMAFPLQTGLFIASIVLGAAAVAQVCLFGKLIQLDTASLIVSSAISVAFAAVLSHASAVIPGDPAAQPRIVAAVLAVSSGFILWVCLHDSRMSTDIQPLAHPLKMLGASVGAGMPIMLEIILAALILGSSWQDIDLKSLDGKELPFLIAVVLCFCAIIALGHIWKKTSQSSFLLYGIGVSLFITQVSSIAPEAWSGAIPYALMIFSLLSFLAYAWIGAQMLDKSPDGAGIMTTMCFILFLVAFGLCAGLLSSFDSLIVRRIVSLASLAFLLYLLFYALHSSSEMGAADLCQSGADEPHRKHRLPVGDILEQNCNKMAQRYELSPREAELLPMIVSGLSSTVIGKRMFISPDTVKTHRYRIYRKMGVSTHEELYDLFLKEKPES